MAHILNLSHQNDTWNCHHHEVIVRRRSCVIRKHVNFFGIVRGEEDPQESKTERLTSRFLACLIVLVILTCTIHTGWLLPVQNRGFVPSTPGESSRSSILLLTRCSKTLVQVPVQVLCIHLLRRFSVAGPRFRFPRSLCRQEPIFSASFVQCLFAFLNQL